MEIAEHLKKNASYLECSSCRRKSYGGSAVNSTCGMPQPDNSRCSGVLRGNTSGTALLTT